MNPNALTKAIATTRRLMWTLYNSAQRPPSDGGRVDADFLFIGSRGSIALAGPDASLYRKCRDELIALHGADSQRRGIGRRMVESLLPDSLLRVLRPTRTGGTPARHTFERRMLEELRRIRREVARGPQTWTVNVRVMGLASAVLPLSFGGVDFAVGTPRVGDRIAASIVDFSPRRRTAARKTEAETASRIKARGELSAKFSRDAVATTTIEAADAEAAESLGVERVRLTLDVMNYFASFMHVPRRLFRAYLGPDGPHGDLTWAVHNPATSFLSSNEDRRDDFPISKFEVCGRVARQLGVVRAGEMLARPRTDIEERIITALAWAGRAKGESRRDAALIQFAIALEALLTKRDSRAGVSDRLRLRAAHLIGRTLEARRNVMKTMTRLYDIRSHFVHSGASNSIDDEDLGTIRLLVELAISAMLTDRRFTVLKDEMALEAWFEDRVLDPSQRRNRTS